MNENNNLLVRLKDCGVQKSSKWIVKGISLEIYKGKIVTLIGPNGSGKTTTAKMALNILKSDEGSIENYSTKMAYVPQKISIDWTMPIYNEIHNLSGGEFQRVLIARAIAKKPDLLVLDEPVQGVDFNGEIALYNLIKEICTKLNCGILLISHDLHFVMSATDHVICLNGHICCSGSPKSIVKNSSYIELFGEHNAATLSLYQHEHDHSHQTDGSVKN